MLLLLLHTVLIGGLIFGHFEQFLLFFDLQGCTLKGLRGEDSQNRLYLLVKAEEFVLFDLSGRVDACFLWLVGRRSGSFFELIGLDLDGDFRRRLCIGILEEEVKIGLYLRIRGRFDVIGGHLLLIPAEVRQLTLHILLLQLLLLPLYVDLDEGKSTSSCCLTAIPRNYFSPNIPSYFFYDYSSTDSRYLGLSLTTLGTA